ncbi:DUF3108 domain-containing protein [Flammeovirga sp. SubArs3]|uniref:DUF3108 domain-containing protein n=1 Tax=Flammeovirga sp. SubArs3 TaxID=2995316 RepID=UPI00248BD62A|nr:DUF3108 domain-containing protein [Flammeovirga sp. SubArs3]
MRLNKKNIKLTCASIFIGMGLFGFNSFENPSDTTQNKKLENPPVLENIEFQKGEMLTYIAGYAMFEAGEAVVKLDKHTKNVNDQECYKVDVTGRSIGIFGMTMKIRDLWQSYFSTDTRFPAQFNRDIVEGGYTLVEKLDFDQENGKVESHWYKKDKPEDIKNEHFEMKPNTHDIISGYYYLRTLDYEKMSEGDTIKMNAFWENKAYDFDIVYLGREKCYTKFGRIDSFVMSPIMPENDLFSGTHPIKFWVSNDVNRIPLKIQAELIVGAVNVDLVRYKGLKEKLKKVK